MKNVEFHPQEDRPSTEAQDVKEATTTMKDMSLDDQVSQRMKNNFSRGGDGESHQ